MGVVNMLRQFVRGAVPHVIVLAVLFGYLAFGAIIFSYLETGHGDMETFKADISVFKNKLSAMMGHELLPAGAVSANTSADPSGPDDLTLLAVGTPSSAQADIDQVLDELMDRSLRPEWKLARMQAVQSKRAWSFASSMLFCLTTITTIGYGDVVPVTVGGKIFCVVYSVFGIPLTMLYMGGIGSFLARLILTLCKILHLGQPIRRAMCPCGSSSRDNAESKKSRSKKKNGKFSPPPQKAKHDGKDGVAAENVIVTTQHGMDNLPAAERQDIGSSEDELEAPVLLVVAMMTGYMCAGALLMSRIERWTYGEALYFTFITLTTIGFGDYVPTVLYSEDAFFACIVYALFGLAVMSMCIALVQAKVRRLGNRFWQCIGC